MSWVSSPLKSPRPANCHSGPSCPRNDEGTDLVAVDLLHQQHLVALALPQEVARTVVVEVSGVEEVPLAERSRFRDLAVLERIDVQAVVALALRQNIIGAVAVEISEGKDVPVTSDRAEQRTAGDLIVVD